MPYRLLRELPTMKAGTIVENRLKYDKYSPLPNLYIGGEPLINADLVVTIPDSVKNDWLEEVDGKWRPKDGETFYVPDLFADGKPWNWYDWNSMSERDNRCLDLNLVCRTKEEAIEKAKLMLEAIKPKE